jgi:hypothetical protein
MSNWGKLLLKENNLLKQEATLLRQQVKLFKQKKTLQQELNFRRSSTSGHSKATHSNHESIFSSSNKENALNLLKKVENQEKPPARFFPSRKPAQSENFFLDERGLLDSFESYYESEEENLDKNGKVELSYLQYKRNHEKGSRRRSKVQETLENKEEEKVKEKTRKISGNRKRSFKISNISVEDLVFRKANCRICDQFLHQGLSSTKCRKHSCCE